MTSVLVDNTSATFMSCKLRVYVLLQISVTLLQKHDKHGNVIPVWEKVMSGKTLWQTFRLLFLFSRLTRATCGLFWRYCCLLDYREHSAEYALLWCSGSTSNAWEIYKCHEKSAKYHGSLQCLEIGLPVVISNERETLLSLMKSCFNVVILWTMVLTTLQTFLTSVIFGWEQQCVSVCVNKSVDQLEEVYVRQRMSRDGCRRT